MSYVPAIPLAGVAGWKFLEKTAPRQQAAFEKSADVKREIAYFEEKIGSVTSAADLVADRRLLKVALTAFGLEGEIDKKAFIRKVLDEGTTDDGRARGQAVGPGVEVPVRRLRLRRHDGRKTGKAGFAATIVSAYKTRAFESAVGEADDNLRLAMNFRREIGDDRRRRREGRELVQGARLEAAARGLRDRLRPAVGLRERRYRPPARHPRREDRYGLRGGHAVGLRRSRGGGQDDHALSRPAQMEAGASTAQRELGGAALSRGTASSGSSGVFNLLAVESPDSRFA